MNFNLVRRIALSDESLAASEVGKTFGFDDKGAGEGETSDED